jgi:site-specific DNA-methyltransferase (adenine-specific)
LNYTLHHGDCLEVMAGLPDASVDMILCDLPYGTTACKWDSVIPFEPLWAQYRRVAKRNAAIVLTASQPFTSALVMSSPRMFKCEWIWEKNRGSNFAATKWQPMKEHESVLVFSAGVPTYNPIRESRNGGGLGLIGKTIKASNTGKREAMGGFVSHVDRVLPADRVPRSIQRFNTQVGLHPTQKPVALMEYMIRTYTHEGDVVLDNCMGSGTVGVACANTGRRFIGIERDDHYFAIASSRIESCVESAGKVGVASGREGLSTSQRVTSPNTRGGGSNPPNAPTKPRDAGLLF